MISEVFVFGNSIDDVDEGAEEIFIFAVIEWLGELRCPFDIVDNRLNISRLDDLLSKSSSILSNHSHNDGVENEIVVIHELYASKGSNIA